MSLWRQITTPVRIFRLLTQEVNKKCFHSGIYKNVNITPKLVNAKPCISYPVRWKSKKNTYDSDDEPTEFDDDSSLSKDSKVVKFSTTSLRTDVVLKSALSISRNKIEQMFYESKIRVNGKKIMKKSVSVKLGDELDVIKMVSPNNSEHLYVARVEILNVSPKEESIQVTARRFKHLLIENYGADKAAVGNEE